jgi:hypothetical protein
MKKIFAILVICAPVFAMPMRSVPEQYNKCSAIAEALQNLKWLYVSKETYLNCQSDEDCVHSSFGGFCGQTVSKTAAAGYELMIASTSARELRDQDRALHCPHPVGMCIAPGKPVCQNNQCIEVR